MTIKQATYIARKIKTYFETCVSPWDIDTSEHPLIIKAFVQDLKQSPKAVSDYFFQESLEAVATRDDERMKLADDIHTFINNPFYVDLTICAEEEGLT